MRNCRLADGVGRSTGRVRVRQGRVSGADRSASVAEVPAAAALGAAAAEPMPRLPLPLA